MRFYDCFIARNNFAFSLTAIKELIEESIRGTATDDWTKCVKHALSVGVSPTINTNGIANHLFIYCCFCLLALTIPRRCFFCGSFLLFAELSPGQ